MIAIFTEVRWNLCSLTDISLRASGVHCLFINFSIGYFQFIFWELFILLISKKSNEPNQINFFHWVFSRTPPPIFTVVCWGTFYLFLYFLILFCAHINLQLGVFYFGKFLASTPPDFPWFRCLSCPSYRSCNCFYFRSNDLLTFLKKQGCGAMRAFSKPVQPQQFNVEFPQIHEDPSWFSLTHRGPPVQHWFGFCTDCQGSVMCLLCYSSRSFVCLVSFCTTGDISVDGLSVDPTSSSLQELQFMKKLQVLQVILKVLSHW